MIVVSEVEYKQFLKTVNWDSEQKTTSKFRHSKTVVTITEHFSKPDPRILVATHISIVDNDNKKVTDLYRIST